MHKVLEENVTINLKTLVVTKAYPDIGVLFKVSTVWREMTTHHRAVKETMVFGPVDLNGEGGESLSEEFLDAPFFAWGQHSATIADLEAGTHQFRAPLLKED